VGEGPLGPAVVFVGHFDDARAAQCPAGERRVRCQDRFVVDTVAWDDGASLAGFPTDARGLAVVSMSHAILDRETDLSGELAIAGWYQESSPVSCPALPSVALPFLEGSCAIPLTWFLEAPESIIEVIQTATSTQFGGSGPLGPAINPVFPTVPPPLAHPLPNQGGSTPTRAILIGHFNDSRASLCTQDQPQVCLGRFVVDAVPWVEGAERVLPERIEPRFDLAVLGDPLQRSLWIVTAYVYGPGYPETVTYVVDDAGAAYTDRGRVFDPVGSGQSAGPT